MSYKEPFMPITAIIQEAEDQGELDFANEDSAEHRELAHQDLTAAKSLADAAKKAQKEDKRTKKALNRKAKQSAMEATEHAQKAVVLADNKHKKISNPEIYSRLHKTHNNSFLQRELAQVGEEIVNQEDIKKLNSSIKRKRGEKSPYNSVRFTDQDITDTSVDTAIEVAEKAIDNLEKKVKTSKRLKIKLNGTTYALDFEGEDT